MTTRAINNVTLEGVPTRALIATLLSRRVSTLRDVRTRSRRPEAFCNRTRVMRGRLVFAFYKVFMDRA
jgi:hypothetical protein